MLPLDPSVSDSAGSLSAGTLTLTEAPAGHAAEPADRRRPSPACRPAAGIRRRGAPHAAAGPAAAVLSLGNAAGAGCPPARARSRCRRSTVPTAPPAAPPQARKVARLVSADAAQSTLKLAADGQLPHLQLQEDDKKDKGQGKSRSIPPLVMILAWILSVVLTVAIVMITSDDGSSSATTEEKKEAMAKIEEAVLRQSRAGELLPYQRLLREARQARARSDFKAERQYYKQVLDLLHTETWGASATQASRNRLEKGITGSRDHDRELEQLILTVLGD